MQPEGYCINKKFSIFLYFPDIFLTFERYSYTISVLKSGFSAGGAG
jgi:hypothetical protein